MIRNAVHVYIQVTEQMLAAFNVKTMGDVQQHRARLSYLFSPISMNFFMHVSLGLPVASEDDGASGEGGRKGMSCERTFAATDDQQALAAKLAAICEHLAGDLQDEGLAAKHITLKIKEATFEVRAPQCDGC
jgi:DNA polymerase kappa